MVKPDRSGANGVRSFRSRARSGAEASARPGASAGTVARVAQLLRILAESPTKLTLTEVAEPARLPLSTTHRLLNLLYDQGLVERDGKDRTYAVGFEFQRLSALVRSRTGLTDIAGDVMASVVAACDETCLLSLYNRRDRRTMLAKVLHGQKPLRYETPTLHPRPLAWGATSRAILAFLPEPVIAEVLRRAKPSPATGAALMPADAKADLAQIRERGYAISRGQMLHGAVGMGAPIFDGGEVIAALCLTIPDSRFEPSQEARFAEVLMGEAARLSARLG